MPSTLSYTGVYLEELPSGVRTVVGVPTSIAAFVGWAAKGPTDKAVRVLGFDDFLKQFGDVDPRSYLGYAVQHFFQNGGSDAYVVRLADADATAAGLTFDTRLVLTAKSPGLGETATGCGSSGPRPVTGSNWTYYRPQGGAAPVVESFDRLSLDPKDGRFVEKVLKTGSNVLYGTLATGATGNLTADLDLAVLNGTAAPEAAPATGTGGGTGGGGGTGTGTGTGGGTPAPPAAPTGVSAPQPGSDGTPLTRRTRTRPSSSPP